LPFLLSQAQIWVSGWIHGPVRAICLLFVDKLDNLAAAVNLRTVDVLSSAQRNEGRRLCFDKQEKTKTKRKEQ
jgi:hypothetical protein